MTPERYQQVDQIFQAALELNPQQRPAFLDEACSGDGTLRSEVESLLTSDSGGLSFIDEPTFDMAARLLASDEPELSAGTRIDRYEILSLLGRGGMGEVYLAHDEKLNRKIALKLLPSDFTTNQERLHRFQQEARAASALNHPNIITIHEIGEIENQNFIATEFVDGETLRQRMKRGALPPHESLDIAIQVSSALAAAHKAGIVHRDIKPENVMLRPDGYVKVLDFGLAKLTDQHEPSLDARVAHKVNVSSGLVMGTVKYMSPEQARGESVDPRSDIFSLGVMLYEMVTGRTPFKGESASDLIKSILKDQPPRLTEDTGYLPDSAEGLQRIIDKALAKDKARRYQSAEDLLVDLKAIKQVQEPGAGPQTIVQRADSREISTEISGRRTTPQSVEYLVSGIKRHKMRAAAASSIFLILTTSFGYAAYKVLSKNYRSSLQNVKLARLTATGKAFNAAISPDGTFVAFVASESNKPNTGLETLWLRQVAANTNVQISPSSAHHYSGLAFSRDGNYLYYFDRDQDDPEPTLYQRPTIGDGASKKKVLTGAINAQTSGAISISPDGNRLVFVREYPSDETAVVIANADGSDERKIASRHGESSFVKAVWSPDGQRIACTGVKQDVRGSYYEVLEMDVQGGSEKPISRQRWDWIDDVVWLSDGSGLLITADDGEGSSLQIWEISYPTGDARNLTTDFVGGYSGLSLTKDSSVLVTTRNETIQNIWTQPADDAGGAKQITTGSAADGWDGMAWTPDGRIVYSSIANGHQDIWIMEADGSNQRQLTANLGSNSFGVSVSDDGRYIAFVHSQAGHDKVWRVNIDGSGPQQLTNGAGETNPVFLPDGWIGYPCEISGKKARCKVPIHGGDPVQVTGPYSDMMRFSPDGRLIAYIPADGQHKGKRIGVVPVDESEPPRIFDLPRSSMPRRMQWSADSRALTYIDNPRGTSNIWSLPIDGGKAVQLTDFKDHFIPSFAWSRDGKQLVMARSTTTNDVVLMRNFR